MKNIDSSGDVLKLFLGAVVTAPAYIGLIEARISELEMLQRFGGCDEDFWPPA
jgi:hypothetical protein